MFFKQSKATTDPRLRSLVQKAARRGHVNTLEKVTRRIYESDDKTWVRSRVAVITFEECWPLAHLLTLEKGLMSKIDALVRVAKAVKQKDAAGLGAMAYAFHEGDMSTLIGLDDTKPVRFVSAALSRPAAFFGWSESLCVSDAQLQVVRAAKAYLPAATWGWDKTCILAGAYLASTGLVPTVGLAHAQSKDFFPYWIAFDKHTPQGKEALHTAAVELGISYQQIIWAGFYLESAQTNAIAESPWWEAERAWRLNKVGLTLASASGVWERVRPILRRLILAEEISLREAIETDRREQQEIFT